MVAVIGYPGESKHIWERFSNKADAIAWLEKTSEELAEQHPAWSAVARMSGRVISEKEASKVRYRDNKKCYP